VRNVNRGEAENFQEVGDNVVYGGGVASAQGREVVAQWEAEPVGQVSSRAVNFLDRSRKVFALFFDGKIRQK
jgi:hypothetical protein